LKSFRSDEVAFNQDGQYWLDVEVFEKEVNQILDCSFPSIQATQLADLEEILELYQGDLLEEFYEDWALRAREWLHTLYLKGLNYVFHYYGFHNVYEKAITYGQQVLDLDPLREEVHREIIRLHIENGQRSLAVQQYRNCKSILAKELGISPMEDTEALYRQIFAEDIEEPDSKLSKEKITMEWALQQLQQANQSIELAKKQIQNVVQVITENSLQQNRGSTEPRTILKK
jgi:two-component SAPR family response regulator